MAITMRLTFDVEVPSLPDDDESAVLIAKTLAPLIHSHPQLPAPFAEGEINLVGASRMTTGPGRGNLTVEAAEHHQTWSSVAHEGRNT